ncbi:chy and ring finger domain [Lichtheimia corymbifera JMRC:FSU:9682]|uniref:Chy and ring finger domain n=1 Tax=Lichtheimia corymbifera JMRC:FSU:9682 TaxID=1263082 RepID=A0A068RF09_9FUNG|nr:chy and ring finger domain [Lichtheimia corymbifera JMRC:FSU:9682]
MIPSPTATHVRSEIVMGGIDTRLQPLRHHVFQLPTPTVIHESKRQETELRKRIRDIYDDPSLESKEKARKVQQLMSSRTKCAATTTTTTPMLQNPALDDERMPTYHDHKETILGCTHYQRKVKLQAECCGRLFTCRFCHDEASDHMIDRHTTKNMMCMLCKTLQPAAKVCRACGVEAARYYCDKCKLWDDQPDASAYHCDDCGICRKGQGLGKDFFHCKTCNVCMTISMQNNHKCIERSLESDCPICGEYMFTSRTPVTFLPCGHCIHKPCYTAYSQTAYQCPTCLKSMTDMSAYFKLIDEEMRQQPMPEEYKSYVSTIFCNDCQSRSTNVPFHFFYHKCTHCASYNTTVLSTLSPCCPPS